MILSIDKKARIDFLDMAKGIGIVLVVSGHVIGEGGMSFRGSDMLRDYLYSFHIALFFVISGILLGHSLSKSKQTNSALIARVSKLIKRLIAPYFIWSLLYFCLDVEHIGDSASLYEWFMCIVTFRGRAPIWFIGALFWAEIIALVVIRLLNDNRAKITACTIGVAVLSVVIWSNRDAVPIESIGIGYLWTSFSRGLVCLVFVLLGYIVSNLSLRTLSKSVLIACAVLSLFGSLTLFIFIGNKANLHTYEFRNLYSFYLFGLLGSIWVLSFCKLICCYIKPKFLQLLGKDSLGIMCIHYVHFPFIIYAKDICSRFGLSGFPAFILSMLFVLGCSLLLAEALNRKLLA